MTVTYSADPDLTWHTDHGHFHMLKQFTATWTRQGLGGPVKVIVPKGFETDLASIPQIFRSIIPQVGRHAQPAIVHDFCYVNDQGGMTKKEADEMFLDGMKSVGVGWLRRRAMYLAVRAGGTGHWG